MTSNLATPHRALDLTKERAKNKVHRNVRHKELKNIRNKNMHAESSAPWLQVRGLERGWKCLSCARKYRYLSRRTPHEPFSTSTGS